MEYIDIPIRCKVVWSLKEWQQREDIMVERKVPRKPMDIVREEREALIDSLEDQKKASWAWRHRA